ncbi:MAG: hypothetical protein HW417_19 [Steroidobacteraceae bacterium]|nr:hypothetical protein [Steroidobacteraceae bacterium]
MACAGSTCLGADTDASTAVVARSTVAAALVTAWVATFSTLRVAARTVFAVLLIADRAWRLADFTVLRVAAVALRTVLRAVLAALRATLLTVLRVVALLRALFLRAAGRRLLRVVLRRAAFLAFFLVAICHLPIFLTPPQRRGTRRVALKLGRVYVPVNRRNVVERKGIEPSTSALRTQRSPS